MTKSDVVILFSGQGKLRSELVSRHPAEVSVRILEACEEIGGAKGQQLASVFGARRSDRYERHTDLLSTLTEAETALLVYCASIAAFRHISRTGWVPGVLLGQSFGEIPALVCAGAFTVVQGAEIVAVRNQALRALKPNAGYMAAIGAGPDTVRAMLSDLGTSDLAIAVENSSTETVVAGSQKAIQRMSNAAVGRGIRFARLSSKYPLHCASLMADVAVTMSRTLRELKAQPLRVPVFSAALGCFLEDRNNLTDYLADSLTRPVRFADALNHLRQNGAAKIIDCSPLQGASRYVGRVFTDSCWHAFDHGFAEQMMSLPPRRLLAKSA
jgi:acyl transferase domain-containing protein